MTLLILLAELLCVAAIVTGIALISVPAAFIVGGLLGVLACERLPAKTPKPDRSPK